MISIYDDLLYGTIQSYGAPRGMSIPDFFGLANAVMGVESNYDPNAVSYTGAGIGLMQINPFIPGYVQGYAREDLFKPELNVALGVRILRDYINQYGLNQGLGSYFAGPTNRATAAALRYAQKVLNFFRNIRSRVMTLFKRTDFDPSSGEWITADPFYSSELELESAVYQESEQDFPWWMALLFFI